MHKSILPFSVLLVVACSGRGGETGEDHDDYTDSSDPGDGSSEGMAGFAVEGSALDLMDGTQTAAEGLCVHAADPTPAISGGEVELLRSDFVGAEGAYSVEGIETTSAVGLLMIIDDCNDEGTVMRTATGIAAATYAGLGTGDVIDERTLFSINATSLESISSGLANAGYTGDIEVDGALIGFIFDAAEAPVDGAEVAGPEGYPTWYLQEDSSWAEGGTVASADGTFIIPGAPIYNYTTSADGMSFDALLAGSQPGHAVVVSFTATE